jgi:hypothetical protein
MVQPLAITSCGTNTKTALVIVSSLPVIIPGTYGPACIRGNNITLGGIPAGGIWSGDGVFGNMFDPKKAGIGNHVLNYKFTDSNGCDASNTTVLTVIPLPETTIQVG